MRIQNIDSLRGIAAIMVAFFHLANLSDLSQSTGDLMHYGYLGVEVFFVISGFILPYSLYVKNYNLSNYPTFILKRLLRLEPGYLATIACTIAISYGFFSVLPSLHRFLLHFGYLNDIFNSMWLVGIFWTLAIEFQFYLFVGLAYKAFTTKNNIVFSLVAVLLLTASLLLSHLQLLPKYLCLFLVGIILFRYMILKINKYLFLVSILAALAVVTKLNTIAGGITAGLTALVILFVKIDDSKPISKVLLFLGTISYSLYLVHWPFGIPMVRQLRHVPIIKDMEILRVFIGVGFSVFIAWIFYLLVEKPSIKWSNGIKYKSPKKTPKDIASTQPVLAVVNKQKDESVIQ